MPFADEVRSLLPVNNLVAHGCCCGLNTILNLPAPATDQTSGAAVDVSGLQGIKTIEVSGNYSGIYSILASHDGNLYFPVAYFNSGGGAQTIRTTVEVVAHFIKVQRNAAQSGTMTFNLAARATVACATSGQGGLNDFLSLAALVPGNTGPQPALDLFTLVAATGMDISNVACSGSFIGQISIESSLDGINFSPLGGFLSSQTQRGSNPGQLMFDPLIVNQVIRYIRVNVLPSTIITGPTSLTIGGPQNCACTTPPPPVSGEGVTVNQASFLGQAIFAYGPSATFTSATGPTTILDQFWYDFSRLSTPTIDLYLTAVTASDGNGDAVFGLFILPDGDPVLGNLFGAIVPQVTFTTANSALFLGSDASAVIANPAAKRQILIAAQPKKSGAADTTISYRSVIMQANQI